MSLANLFIIKVAIASSTLLLAALAVRLYELVKGLDRKQPEKARDVDSHWVLPSLR